MADKADWCDANVKHLIDVCKEEIEAGNRPMGIFTRNGWKNLISKYEEKTSLKQTKKQLKNKLDNMKTEYRWFTELRNCVTGLGWDEAKQTVVCSNEWWTEHLDRCNNAKKDIKCNHVRFKKQGPKDLDDLHILFGKTTVSGASASCPDDISSTESSDEDVSEIQKKPDKRKKRKVIERAFGVLKEKWRILKGIPSYPTRTQKHIIIACMALHNFIRNSNLQDMEFDRCDADEEYLLQQIGATTETHGDENLDGENQDIMNTIRSRIADDLVSA